MTQEQKPLPFEITHPKDLSVSDIFNYVDEANAEIRRLQHQLADAPTWGVWVDAMAENIENPYLNVSLYEFEFDNGALEILSLTQEMKWLTLDGNDVTGEFYSNDRDVLPVRFRRLNYEPKAIQEAPVKSDEQPTKVQEVQDDWTPITDVKQLRGLATGYYLLRGSEGCGYPPFIALKQRNRDTDDGELYDWSFLNRTGGISRRLDDDVMCEDSYKLIHAFEEPEKKYKVNMFGGSEELTLAEIAERCDADDVSELAKDLLAAQARIRELEGK